MPEVQQTQGHLGASLDGHGRKCQCPVFKEFWNRLDRTHQLFSFTFYPFSPHQFHLHELKKQLITFLIRLNIWVIDLVSFKFLSLLFLSRWLHNPFLQLCFLLLKCHWHTRSRIIIPVPINQRLIIILVSMCALIISTCKRHPFCDCLLCNIVVHIVHTEDYN